MRNSSLIVPSLRNTFSHNGTPRVKKVSVNNSKMLTRKRRSLRKQHSISLHIPIEEVDSNPFLINCYINLPRQVFNLTYLQIDETQNPDSLASLTELTKKNWQTYLVGYLNNFNYQPAQIRALSKALKSTISTEFQKSNVAMIYDCEVTVVEEFSPTKNDNKALLITVTGTTEQNTKELYKGYLMSWCNPYTESGILLPILLCLGNIKYQTLIHSVLSERFDVIIKKLTLTQEDFMHLSTYCIVMLDRNDSYSASFYFKIPPGTMKLDVAVKYILELWENIHKDDGKAVELDEILLFHDALNSFYESNLGINLGYAHFKNIIVRGCFSLNVNAQMWFSSTRIMHVVLKYLSYLAIQKLKLNLLNNTEENGTISRVEL